MIHKLAMRRLTWLATALVATLWVAGAAAAPTGARVQGKVLAADTGEPLAAADVLLIPSDTTAKRVGGFTNLDGTFLLEVPPGLYTLQVRAISYRTKRVTGVSLKVGELLPITVTVETEAIEQEEIVVEARLKQNTEQSLLVQRQRASTVGDAVSAEAVRRTPDRAVADVLRRVTGLSVSDGKYVYVRGMGERYSSTEIDGVRLVSPETNKRVVPLDLVPAALLENVVVQKTYTADRPGEFGGGDVQVRTRDFPGQRTFSLTLGSGAEQGTTFSSSPSYIGSRLDWLGAGASDREMPDIVTELADGKRVVQRGLDPNYGFTKETIALMGQSFDNVWTPGSTRAPMNLGVSQNFGDEWRVFGRPLGLVQSLTYAHNMSGQEEIYRTFSPSDALVDYAVQRNDEIVNIGAMAALSYRLTPDQSLHARVIGNRSADDEIRSYQGWDYVNDRYLTATRLLYSQRTMLSGLLEGKHELRPLGGAKLDWKASLSSAEQQQPDRRESTYYRDEFYDQETEQTISQYVLLTGTKGATREFGTQEETGRGLDGALEFPIRRGRTVTGKVTAGFSAQEKDRSYDYRRFAFVPPAISSDAPESLFVDSLWVKSSSPTIDEWTYDDDNYDARQEVTAGFLNFDFTLSGRLRAVLGVRVEHGIQHVRNFDIFRAGRVTSEGRIDNVDWLPAFNATWQVQENANLRFGASRTLSRPDLRELSPAKAFEYAGGYRRQGNPDLERARIDNYDLRYEVFPQPAELVAAGVFYKQLHDPIEDILRPGDEVFFQPFNSEGGRNFGLELEARANLARIGGPMRGVFANANLSVIDSRVEVSQQASQLVSPVHQLQGQANVLLNGGLTWLAANERTEASLLCNFVGRRLESIAAVGTPDFYQQPVLTLDGVINLRSGPAWRLKVSGKNLTDASVETKQGDRVTHSYRPGRVFSVSLAYGS